jgi:hypothetical protein
MSKHSDYIRDHWLKVRGFYFLVYDKKGSGRLYARTRSSETAEKLQKLGFSNCTEAWNFYRKRIADYDLY